MVRVRFFAALRDAAGTSEAELEPAQLGELLSVLRERYGSRFTEVLGYSSVLVDGERGPDLATRVPDGAEVALLPPFSGGA
jgi:molybdopterin synthase sulfur carrier subunit